MSHLEVQMLATMESAESGRRALRRAVQIECSALSPLWEDTAPLVATNLSQYGIWLGSAFPLEVGEQMVLCFRPPHWPTWDRPVTVRAEVVRVGLPRRRADLGPAGMGLRFVDLGRYDCARMAVLLRGLPPPLPARVEQAGVTRETELVEDGVSFELRAEAPLLTECRRKPSAPQPNPAEPRLRVKRRSPQRPLRTSHRTPKTVTARRPHLRLVG
jgi:hypothetical protein